MKNAIEKRSGSAGKYSVGVAKAKKKRGRGRKRVENASKQNNPKLTNRSIGDEKKTHMMITQGSKGGLKSENKRADKKGKNVKTGGGERRKFCKNGIRRRKNGGGKTEEKRGVA